MQYVTIASTGNTTDFGDLSSVGWLLTSTANSTRGIFASGTNDSGRKNVMDYISIASTGNATDFGDLTSARNNLMNGMVSSAHGGL